MNDDVFLSTKNQMEIQNEGVLITKIFKSQNTDIVLIYG